MEESAATSKSFLRRIRESELVVSFLLSAWIFMVLMLYMGPMALVLPIALIPGFGQNWYRRITGVIDYYGRQIMMCIPFSWCGNRCIMYGSDTFMKVKEGGNSIILANHGSRIDWIGAEYVAMCGRAPTNWRIKGSSCPRVNFVAEVTTALMPIAGWSRFLFGDILLQRAFHKDSQRILDNITDFKKIGVERCLFLAPEGTIADPGAPDDEAYIADCSNFMRKLGKKPLTYLLTPRYKGMTNFVTLAPGNVAGATLAFVTEYSDVNEASGVVVGGRNCTLELNNPRRKIPDLHDIFTGGLTIYINFATIDVSADADAVDKQGQSMIKTQLVEDQVRKDKELAYFAKHRKFQGVKSGADWTDLRPIPGSPIVSHIYLNGMMVGGLALEIALLALCFGTTMFAVSKSLLYMFLTTFVMHTVSYNVGRLATDGVSRESLVGETAIKALLTLLTGRSTNQGGKAKTS
jgi:1-acyl-sn-glycerol-3-phosphate acyltransferase